MPRTLSITLRSAGCLAVAICLLATSARAQVGSIPSIQPNGGAAQPKGTAVIRGHVFDGENGRPLRRALVRASATDIHNLVSATTDEQGLYEMRDLPAGHYVATANKANYISTQYGALANQPDTGKPLDVRDSQTVEKIDVTLARGGVITGRVVDEYGDPAPNVQVQAMRPRFNGVRRILEAGGRGATLTDDLGDYRIFGLYPADYYVSAALRSAPAAPGDDDAPGYAVTYAPGTASASDAQRITITAGRSVDGVNVALVAVKTAQVSGTAVNSQGAPLAGANVLMIETGGELNNQNRAQTRPDGTFAIVGVAPGDYTIYAQNSFKRGELPEIATANISVAGRRIEGVQLVALAPVTISGTVTVDPAAGPTRPSSIGLMVTQVDSPVGGSLISTAQLKDDFTFEAKASPGTNIVRVNNMPAGMGLRAVRAGGVDVTDTGFEIKPNGNVSGIEVELTSHPTNLSGQVSDGHGTPSSSGTVVMFSRDEQKWSRLSLRYTKIARPDHNGQYKITDLAPGDYYVAIAGTTQQSLDSFRDPELLKQLIAGATSISLNEGETKTLDLKTTSVP